jgi:hypothetical protein
MPGSAAPAALGAKLADPDRRVLAVMGDGGFMFSNAELATAVQYRLNVVSVVYETLRATYQTRRDYLHRALTRAGFKPLLPEATCFLMADISGYSLPATIARPLALAMITARQSEATPRWMSSGTRNNASIAGRDDPREPKL